jgi:L-amino acid N-acyltransferase YncA
MHIRDFDDRDVSPANALINRYIRDTATHFAYAEATDGQFRDSWQRGRQTHPWLAAEVGGRFAGFARAGPWRDRDAYRFSTETSVYIEPDFHRRGVGRALMEALLDRLQSAGFRVAVAGATLPRGWRSGHPDTPASVPLHEALGFQFVGVFPEVGYKLDRWWDVGFWVKRLG